MSVTEHLMRPGSGSLQLASSTPTAITNQIRALVDEGFGTSAVGAAVVITRHHIDPNVVDDDVLLSTAVYNGPITARPSRLSLEFSGLGAWLDSYLDSAASRTSGTPSQWMSTLLANGLTAGTVTATGMSNITRTFPAHSTTRREALDAWVALAGGEYRINPDLTVDVATSDRLFREAGDAGTIVVTRHGDGPDGTLRGVDSSLLDQELTQLGPSLPTKAVALGSGNGTTITKGTATTSRNVKTPAGGTPTMVTVFSAPSEASGNVNSLASNFLALQGMRRKVNISSSTHNLARHVEPGDEVYVFDPQNGLYDTSNPVSYRGETIFPIVVRLLSFTWPIQDGYGVYVRPNAATPEYIDLTDHVAWETGDTWWTVGDWSPPFYGRTNRRDPDIEWRTAANY